MRRILNPNLEIMVQAVTRLDQLCNNLVFIGGCATGLLITDPAAPEVRPTIDVDAIVEVTSLSEYYKLEKELQDRGFKQSMQEDAPICRWVAEEIILDVIPTDPKILGFGNKWHKPAIKNAAPITLENNITVNMVSAPYFLATKMEAFLTRGEGDYYASHDLEDVIAVIDGRPKLIDEIENEGKDLKKYLAEIFETLIKDERFLEAIPGHLPPDEASQARSEIILKRINQIITKNT